MDAIGIDLGTTYSAASHVDRWGNPVLIPDCQTPDEYQTPSVLLHQPLGCIVGEPVVRLLEETPDLPVVRFAKLSMGIPGAVSRDSNGKEWNAHAISSRFIAKILRDARMVFGSTIEAAVVTVPANFNDSQRRATRAAALLGGLVDIHLVEEPVAAAMYFGLHNRGGDRTVMVYDLGGGTFDATVLQLSPDGLFVLATRGANQIGGKVFDERIMEYLADQYRRRYGIHLLSEPLARLELYRLAEQVKISLSREMRVRRATVLAGRPFEFSVSREHFEQRISSLVEQTLRVCQSCLDACYLGWKDVNNLILTGGSTLVPLVNHMIRESSGLSPSSIHDSEPHYAVAYGAGILAASHYTGKQVPEVPSLVQQVSTFGVGLQAWNQTSGGMAYEEIVKRNQPLPVRVEHNVRTSRTGQEQLHFEVYTRKDGESAPERLDGFSFGPLPPGAPAGYGLNVALGINAEGMVEMTASDPQTGEEVHRVLAEGSSDEGAMVLRERPLVEGSPLL